LGFFVFDCFGLSFDYYGVELLEIS